MAKFNGANLRYNNSDDENRVYDLSAEVVVNNNKVEAVNITASKDGQHIGSANINGLGTETGNSSFNFNVPLAEINAPMAAMTDFAQSCCTAAATSETSETLVP